MRLRVLVLGTESFLDEGPKVGSQYLAEAMAREGWAVDYVPSLSSPLDVILPARRRRFSRAWVKNEIPVLLAEGLREWSFRTTIPPHRVFVRNARQLDWYRNSLLRKLGNTSYDVCITDVCANMLVVDEISARVKVCRLQDWPWGFESDVHRIMISAMESLLKRPVFREVWAVSRALEDYSLKLCSPSATTYLPNGFDKSVVSRFDNDVDFHRTNFKRAVFLGRSRLLDKALITDVAVAMPDWEFRVYGAGRRHQGKRSNLLFLGSIGRGQVPEVLQSSSVGLIPFEDSCGRMAFVERPLKFYEYVAAGLGVASTDIGGLRAGMGDWACFGNGVEGFSRAIREAAERRLHSNRELRHRFLADNVWSARTDQMIARIRKLAGRHAESDARPPLDNPSDY